VGDGGETVLGGGRKVPKNSLRVETYGTVDELNSHLGLALAAGLDPAIVPLVSRVQQELFRLGSDLCLVEEDKGKARGPQMEKRHIETLEAEMDRFVEKLGPLEEFVLPGGSTGASQLHVARTVCRRAERLLVSLSQKEPIGAFTIPYLNRLSDWLFVLARFENRSRGVSETLWDKKT